MFTFIYTNLRFLLFIIKQRRYLNVFVKQNIIQYFNEDDDTLTAEQFKRIKYHCLIMPVVIGDIYCQFWKRNLKENEREILSFFGAFAPLMDDFFDKEKRSEQEIRKIIFSPADFIPQSNAERLSKHILEKLHYLALPIKSNWEETAIKQLEWQQRSTLQVNCNLTKAEIREITFKKGGYSFLLGRLFLNTSLHPNEIQAAMHFGGMLQYIDDIFDIWEDVQNNISTLANYFNSVEGLEKDYTHNLNELFIKYQNLAGEKKSVTQFNDLVLLLFVRAFVAIEQYKNVEAKYRLKFNHKSIPRKELICDMESFKSFIKTWVYFRNFKVTKQFS